MRARSQSIGTAGSRAAQGCGQLAVAAGSTHDPETGTRDGPDARTSAVERLLQRSARGDRTAFAQLYDAMATPVYVVILSGATTGPQADRLLLEVFLGLWERCPLYEQNTHSAVSWILAYAEQATEYDTLAQSRG